MLQLLNKKLSCISNMKLVFLLLCMMTALSITIGGNFSYIIMKTPTLINQFVNGLDPDGDLIIQKIVEHPFGDTYEIPDHVEFKFEVNLGAKYANQTVKITECGEKPATKTVDEEGKLILTVLPGGRASVFDIDEGTVVTVKEIEKGKGFTPDSELKEIEIRKHQENILTFKNTYTPEKADTSILNVMGVKTLKGREWQEGDCFTFALEVYDEGEKKWSELGRQNVTYGLMEQSFDEFDFTEQIQSYEFNEVGNFCFKVYEVEGTIDGITYDKEESRFKVVVADADMDGFLEIQSVEAEAGNTAVEELEGKFNVSIEIENHYAPTGSAGAEIKILKTMEDASGQKSPEGFRFELYGEDGSLLKTSEPTDHEGKTSISMVYAPDEAGKTCVYTLKEKNAGETIDGIVYDDKEYKIQADVIDNLDGTVSVKISEYNETTEASEDEKVLSETEGAAESASFTEDIVEDDAPAEPQQPDAPVEVDVVFVSSSVGEAKQDSLTCQFINKYISEEPLPCTVDIFGTKVLNGRTLKAGEFSFHLYQTDEIFEIKEELQPTATDANEADGAICFGNLEFDKVGSYYYVVTEDRSNPLRGITYDETRYLVRITVTDENGALKAEQAITDAYGTAADEGILFRNSYKAFATSLSLSGKKVLVGKNLENGEFYFQIFAANEQYAAQGTPLQTVKNDENGEFHFEDLKYETAGVYHYIVLEDDSVKVEGMEYDDTVYGISVTVSDNGQGDLITDVSMNSEGNPVTELVFRNIYAEPEKPEDDKPVQPEKPVEPEKPKDEKPEDEKPVASDEAENGEELIKENVTQNQTLRTGDANPIIGYAALAVLSIIAVIVLGIIRCQKKK